MPKAKFQRVKDFNNGVVTISVLGTDDSITAQLSELPEPIVKALALYGLNDKLGSTASGAENPIDAMVSIYNQLKAGEWDARGEGSSRATLLAEAIAQVTGEDLVYVSEQLSVAGKDEVARVRKDPRITAAMAEIKVKRAQAAAKIAKKDAKGLENKSLGDLFSTTSDVPSEPES